MFKPNFTLSSLVLISMVSLAGCAKAKNDGGSVKLQFSNTQSTAGIMNSLSEFFFQKAFAYTVSTPSEFKMKLVAAYLSADIDPATGSNIGADGIFYLNPECNGDIKHCDISGGTAEDGAPISNIITTAFDFGQSSTLVNQALNAQAQSIPVAEYKYVRLEFCKLNQENANNLAWQGGYNNTETEFNRGNCTVTSAVMDPPLSIAKGESATVKLTYDYSSAISVGADAQGDNCTGSGDSTTCFTLPAFVPTATK